MYSMFTVPRGLAGSFDESLWGVSGLVGGLVYLHLRGGREQSYDDDMSVIGRCVWQYDRKLAGGYRGHEVGDAKLVQEPPRSLGARLAGEPDRERAQRKAELVGDLDLLSQSLVEILRIL